MKIQINSFFRLLTSTVLAAILVLFIAPNLTAQNSKIQDASNQATDAAKQIQEATKNATNNAVEAAKAKAQQLQDKANNIKIEGHSTHDGHQHSNVKPALKIQGGDAKHGHDHSGHDHGAHGHEGHDHSGHGHGAHDGHNHGKQNNPNLQGGKKKAGGHGAGKGHGKGHGHSADGHGHKAGAHGNGHGCGCADYTQHEFYDPTKYDAVGTAMGHIADANEFHIFGHSISLPLPVMLYSKGNWTTGTTSMFEHGHKSVDGYVLDHHGRVKRILGGDAAYMQGTHDICTVTQYVPSLDKNEVQKVKKGKPQFEKKDFACVNGVPVALENSSTLDGGLFGGGFTSFCDFSITKNVFTMMLAGLLLCLLFIPIARKYKSRAGMAPKGTQSLMEVFFTFIRDEVTKPMIGPNYAKYQPFIMSLFFFVLVCNLLGLVPFFPGSSNVTGNLAVTLALAFFTLVITTINGNRHYWEHVLWMPGIPWWVKVFVLTPVEILGLLIKPFSLMIRLFANITAGHIIILSLIGLIFLFGKMGTNIVGAGTGIVVGGLFTAFMNLIEMIVAFIQAFIFATLSASYIGAAVEEPAHH